MCRIAESSEAVSSAKLGRIGARLWPIIGFSRAGFIRCLLGGDLLMQGRDGENQAATISITASVISLDLHNFESIKQFSVVSRPQDCGVTPRTKSTITRGHKLAILTPAFWESPGFTEPFNLTQISRLFHSDSNGRTTSPCDNVCLEEAEGRLGAGMLTLSETPQILKPFQEDKSNTSLPNP